MPHMLGENLAIGNRGNLVLGERLGGTVVAVADVHSSSTLKASQNYYSDHSAIAHAPTYASVQMGPVCLWCGFTKEWVLYRLRAVSGCEGQGGLALEAHLRRAKDTITSTSTGSESDS